MTELDFAIEQAYASQGTEITVNKVYLKFLQTHFFIPVRKENQTDEPFLPLFSKVNDHYFMLAFDTLEKLEHWAGEHLDEMGIVQLFGQDLILGINNQVYLSLNLGTAYHKEFSPEEMTHLKKIVSRIRNL